MNQKKRILWSVLVLFLVAVAIVAVLFGIWKKEEKQERENKKQEDVIQKETEDNSLKSEEAEPEETGTGIQLLFSQGMYFSVIMCWKIIKIRVSEEL